MKTNSQHRAILNELKRVTLGVKLTYFDRNCKRRMERLPQRQAGAVGRVVEPARRPELIRSCSATAAYSLLKRGKSKLDVKAKRLKAGWDSLSCSLG